MADQNGIEWHDDPTPEPRRLDPLDPAGLALPWSTYTHPIRGDQPVLEFCREWVETKANYCGETAECILWGKLFPPEALGPRCHNHAYQHAPGAFEATPGQWAIFDLRNLYRKAEREARNG